MVHHFSNFSQWQNEASTYINIRMFVKFLGVPNARFSTEVAIFSSTFLNAVTFFRECNRTP